MGTRADFAASAALAQYAERATRATSAQRADSTDRAVQADSATTSTTVLGLTTAEVLALNSHAIGTTYVTSGKSAPGDGKDLRLLVKPGSAVVDNLDVLLSTSSYHIYRLGERACGIVRTTVVGDGVADDTAAVQNAVSKGKHLQLERSSRIRLTDTVYFTAAAAGPGSLIEGPPGVMNDNRGPYFVWDRPGSADRPMFSVGTSWTKLRGFYAYANTGRNLLMFLDFAVPGGGATALHLEDIWVSTYGTLQNGITIDYAQNSAGNLEDCLFRNVMVANFQNVGLWIRGGQPFNVLCDRVSFANYLGTSGVPPSYLSPNGTGVRVDTGVCSLQMRDTVWGALSVGLDLRADCRVRLTGDQDNEYLKRLLDCTAVAYVTVEGGRLESAVYADGVAATNPTIAADDSRYIRMPGPAAGLFAAKNVTFIYGAIQPNWRAEFGPSVSWSFENCYFPNKNPITIKAVDSFQDEGSISMVGCVGMASAADGLPNGRTYEQLPTIVGGIEHGHIDFSGTQTTLPITWYTPRAKTPNVEVLRMETISGSPAASSLNAPAISDVDRYGARLTLGAAPGAGATVRAHYQARRYNHTQTSGQGLVVEAMASDTSRRKSGASCGWTTGNTYWLAGWLALHTPLVPDATTHTLLDISVAGDSSKGLHIFWNNLGAIMLYERSTNSYWTMSDGLTDANSSFRMLPWMFSYAAGQLSVYDQGVFRGTTTGLSFASLAATAELHVGYNPFGANQFAAKASNVGICGGTGTPTLANYQAWITRTLETKTFAAMPGVPNTHVLRFDGAATVVNTGSAGSAGNVTTTAGALALSTMRMRPSSRMYLTGFTAT